jgi:hypothetical protein
MNDKLEKCPSCEYHKGSEKTWRDLAKKQAEEIEYWKEKFNTAMDLHNTKPAKYTDAWWKEVAQFNKENWLNREKKVN